MNKYEKQLESIYFWTKVKFGIIVAVLAGGFYYVLKYLPAHISFYFIYLLGTGAMLFLGIVRRQFHLGINKIKSDEAFENQQ